MTLGGFQVMLPGQGFGFVREALTEQERERSPRGRGGGFAGIVLGKALGQVLSEADIQIPVALRAEDVDAIGKWDFHGPGG